MRPGYLSCCGVIPFNITITSTNLSVWGHVVYVFAYTATRAVASLTRATAIATTTSRAKLLHPGATSATYMSCGKPCFYYCVRRCYPIKTALDIKSVNTCFNFVKGIVTMLGGRAQLSQLSSNSLQAFMSFRIATSMQLLAMYIPSRKATRATCQYAVCGTWIAELSEYIMSQGFAYKSACNRTRLD
jgi:hypothetical protein